MYRIAILFIAVVAAQKMMEEKQLVNNIMDRMIEDSLYQPQLLGKIMADEESYNSIIDTTLSDSALFFGLIEKIKFNEQLREQVITQADEWKKETARSRRRR
jgi:hypothetical protein